MKKFLSMRRARREEGMALLFALGFLALMLILGLGYVTTSLLARKIAANNSSRAQARMFARSAAARAMLNIMLYNDQAVLGGRTIENYDSVYSYDKVAFNNNGTKHPNSELSDAEFKEKLRKDPDAVLNDQLCKSSDTADDESKLKYQVGTEDYTGETCQAKWMFFYDAPASVTGRRIIGRAAFQVLPRQAGRLSLYGILGAKINDDYYSYAHQKQGSNVIHYRWGRNIAELNLERSKTLNNWYASLDLNTVPFKYSTLYDTYSTFFPAGDANTETKKHWIEYWFAEGKNPVLKEAFSALDPADNNGRKVIYYNRFNIGDYYYTAEERGKSENDNWYDRFKAHVPRTSGWADDDTFAAKKNTPEALNMLSAGTIVYKENDTTDHELNPAGLPFLRRIGNDKWTFETLELLRRQIAANFNDYCDEDSIPTSDIPAADWSITDSEKFPKYTGNEKTLYINEVAAAIHDITLNYDTSTYVPKVQSAYLTLLVELVNMYDNSDTAASKLLVPSNVKLETGLKKLGFKIVLGGEYTVKVTYLRNNREMTKRFTFPFNADFSNNAYSATINCVPETPTVTIENFPALTKGYSVGKTTEKDLSEYVTQPSVGSLRSAIENAARDQVPSGGVYRSFEIERARLGHKIRTDSPVTFELMPLLLRANKDITAGASAKVVCPANTGVDFVRLSGAIDVAFGDNLVADALRNSGTPSGKSYYIGGIEAKDPRQNLNAHLSGNSDWTIAPKFLERTNAVYNAGGTPPSGAPSMELPVNISGSCLGRVNSDGNPARTKSGFARTGVDSETATDPAWLADTAGKHVSTAYIRNAPMVSPWEIGLIHRAGDWQTLNLKRAGGFGTGAGAAKVKLSDIKSGYGNWTDAGTTYANGDGAILEFVKLGINCRCMGKVPLTLLRTEVIKDNQSQWNNIALDYNRDLIRMLFDGIRVGQTMKQFYAETKFGNASAQGGTSRNIADADVANFVTDVDQLYATKDSNNNREFRLRSQFLNTRYGDKDKANGKYSFSMANTGNDAAQEEIIGKTINLLTVNEETPPNIFKAVIVAQTIRDVGGIVNPVTISKIHRGNDRNLQCQIGRFDFVADQNNWDNNTYFDEITGEAKAVVTIERVPATDDNGNRNADYGRMIITNIEFID